MRHEAEPRVQTGRSLHLIANQNLPGSGGSRWLLNGHKTHSSCWKVGSLQKGAREHMRHLAEPRAQIGGCGRAGGTTSAHHQIARLETEGVRQRPKGGGTCTHCTVS